MSDLKSKAKAFRALHERPGSFVMPNAWDRGSALLLARAGFEAIATTSAGTNYANGTTDWDYHVPREEMLRDFGQIARIVDVPCNGDLENGYGDSAEDVAETIRQSIAAGMVGGGIEDYTGDKSRPIYDLELAKERIIAAREAADASGIPYVLTGRYEGFLAGVDGAFAEAVQRLNLYREAGADVLYAPGPQDPDQIARLVAEVDGPLNVVVGRKDTQLNVQRLTEAGVKRISIGGALFHACYGYLRQAAEELIGPGTFNWTSTVLDRAYLTNAIDKAADQ
ncbi:MAG: isocitrate lyase/phosphoenolpyruvate mutase family protein [Proteobacteria bacterium]|nr:isocitrate lyase/phosphoenolpyruvate mutase family protein [Pseudomonadota bacterium]MDA1308932.1 isocitrate lyase/phosphoenolpyruvate mutase family protein [Pseudomonadota bacterium]